MYLRRLEYVCLKVTTGLHGEEIQTEAISGSDEILKCRRRYQNTKNKKEHNNLIYRK
jgi:hypothetical protein